MQSRLFAKKVTQLTAQGSILEAFGVTLEHFGHQMASQSPFFERLKICCKNGNGLSCQERAVVGGGAPYKQVAKLGAWRPGPSLQAYEASKLP